MSESVHQDLPATHADDHIALRMSAEQILVIRKAAELAGWTVTDYVLSTVLDRAERDLYEHAAALEAAAPTDFTDTDPSDPFLALLSALT
ncbi:type II toxin -antitoxin system TacA 1-like antitoxin [Actinomadura livida]|uniref:Uncharacterized protein (DUF1778 family) n=1 Tax=Actinomadura livida TaxID=79909 RepID=A0A7W7IH41_9ACTN|nr:MULTISPECIES: DUF1778 domain-containing protein [Actinomadura]MBB4776860.1 uncharacterized protein (DUF1778 family) [Actinomadura catellatispora]GGT95387.1 hypothetical protein GCM10010208_18320 [Actinomadura livida]